MTTAIDKRLKELERRLQPPGRVFVAWPMDSPDLYELKEQGKEPGELLTLEAIEARLKPNDVLLEVVYNKTGNHGEQNY